MSSTSCASDYEFQLSFPSGDFVYTDLRNWAAKSVDPLGETILFFQADAIFDSFDEGCLEGRIQNPNLTLTLRIVNRTNPNDVLSFETINLSDIAEIGTPGTTTTLSQAVADGDLLDGTLSQFFEQRVLIEGDLIVDQDYTFGLGTNAGDIGRSQIILSPGSSIIVDEAVDLELLGTTIRGCSGDRWGEIIINDNASVSTSYTEIRNATTGIELLDGGTCKVRRRTIFRDNEVGIGSYGDDFKTVTLDIFEFQGNNPFLMQFYGDGTGRGIVLENTSPQVVLDATIQDLDIGIYLKNSSAIIRKVSADNCNRGIYSEGISGMLDMFDLTLSNNNLGVFADGQIGLINFRKSTTTNNTTGLRFHNQLNSVINVSESFFFRDFVGMVGVVFPSRAQITNNTFRSDYANIGVLGLGEGDHLWEIAFNGLFDNSRFSGQKVNVLLNNTNCARIFRNTDIVGDNNIRVYGGSENVVGYNGRIFGQDNGIYLSDSPMSRIFCNDIESDLSFQILDNSAGADIRGNSLKQIDVGSGLNLQYGSSDNAFALAGNQLFKGNLFNNSSTSNIKAQDYNEIPRVAQRNEYVIGDNAQIGSVEFPHFSSINPGWFNGLNGSNYICPQGLVEIVDTIQDEVYFSAVSDYFETRVDVSTLDPPAIPSSSTIKVMRQLDNVSFTLPSNQYSTEIASLASSVYMDYLDLENDINELLTIDSLSNFNYFQDLQGIETEIIVLNDQLVAAYDSVENRHLLDSIGRVNFVATLDNLNSLTNSFQNDKDSINSSVVGQFPLLYSDLNSLQQQSPDPYLSSLLGVNAVYLKMLDPVQNASASDSTQVLFLASSCNKDEGEAVFPARSIELLLSNGLFSLYNDECMSFNSSLTSEDNNYLRDESEIYPNPAINNIYYKARSVCRDCDFKILSANGQDVRIISADRSNDIYSLDFAEAKAGVYALVVSQQGEIVDTKMFVIK